ncbi:hypothetical protein SD37_16810 [Amycolatopsis orientalis]|uniref:Glycosyltransferase n=1 Tax=Amycolatopsis orientalis TaxID=31958 RepID=A0A193BY93_AMYOR|nr:glycosyltransferase [Amycolatopsis orientalis]ANN17138.1 hypothetical protein SD37_16810 [Amycolatopsis orientalis]
MTGLSVVIPTRDKPASLRATLACLAVSPLAADEDRVEIRVVDDGEDDGRAVAEVVGRFESRLNVRRIKGPRRGRAAVRNLGAEDTGHARLLFLDDDILTAEGFLAAHLALADDPGFAHGPLREFPGARRWLEAHADDEDGELAREAARVLGGGERLMRGSLEAAILAVDSGRAAVGVPWLASVGANLAVPRTVFDRVGGFDEGFGTHWGCEDLELGVRLCDAGCAPVVAHDAAGVHLTHARPDRWKQHDITLTRFRDLHDRADVRALPELLGEAGSAGRYFARLDRED